MKVLGINFSYDASASIVEDGKVVFAVQEERFARIKHYAGFPSNAISSCLQACGCSLNDLDAISFFWNPAIHATAPSWRLSSIPRHHLEYLFNVPNHLLPLLGKAPNVFEQVFYLSNGKRLPIFYVTHHLAHAAGGFFSSPFEEAAILTVDGYGERDSTVIWKATKTGFERVWTQEFPHSLGSFYAAVTQYLGFKPNSGEGKVMGLASYGKPIYLEEFSKMLRLTEDGFEIDLSYFSYYLERPTRYSEKMVQLLGEPRLPESPITERHQDIAASLQMILEEAILHLARIAQKRVGLKTFVMSGGVALNCSANGRLVRSGLFDRYFFQPPASDAGSSLGSALYVTHCILGCPRGRPKMLLDYLGPEYDNNQIRDTLEKGGARFISLDDPADVVGKLLARGYIGSVFHGRAEFGPRALGNRSTLADPRPREVKDILNARVKFREPFRPFAPSVLAEYSEEYFEGADFSPFMLRVFKTRGEKINEAQAVTHVDGGARVQTVKREYNPRFYDIISAFHRETNTPLVLNTSFNIRGEPIVNTPSDALKCFYTTGMDFLLIGDFLLLKDGIKI